MVGKREDSKEQGCTGTVVLVNETNYICANAGDSRSILQAASRVYPLSNDHKPVNGGEKKRIINSGHTVENERVDGYLAVSRAFGDFQFKDKPELMWDKQAVTANPDFIVRDRKEGDQFIALACDGIWDCLSNDDFCDKVNAHLNKLSAEEKENNRAKIIEQIFDEICAKEVRAEGIGTDNMTCILAFFN